MSISSLNTNTSTLPATSSSTSSSSSSSSPSIQSQTSAAKASLVSTTTSQASDSPSNSSVNLNVITTIPTPNTTTTQLVKGKELISNKTSGDLLKIKVTNHVDRQFKTSLNDTKPIIIGNSLLANVASEQLAKLDSVQAQLEETTNSNSTNPTQPQTSVLTASKLNTPGLVKSKIMTSGGGIQICLTQPNSSNINSNLTATSTAITPTLQTLTLSTPKSLIISSPANTNTNTSNSIAIAQTIKLNPTNSSNTPINVPSGQTTTILNVLNDTTASNNLATTVPPVIKAISFNQNSFIPIQTNSNTTTTPTTPTTQFNPILDVNSNSTNTNTIITTTTAPSLVNLPTLTLPNNRKINSTIKTTTASSKTTAGSNLNPLIKSATQILSCTNPNSNSMNAIVKSLLANSSASPSTLNAAAAVQEAAKIFINESTSIPTTTTITLSNNLNSITSNGSKILSTTNHLQPQSITFLNDSNDNTPPTTTTTTTTTLNHKINVPSISSASKIVLTNNVAQKVSTVNTGPTNGIQTVTTPTSQGPAILSLDNTASKTSIPINLKATQSNGVSPVSFLIDQSNGNNSITINPSKLNTTTRTIITNSASTTPPPQINSTTISHQQLPSSLINTSNFANYIKNNTTSGNGNNIITIPTNSTNIYKTVTHSTQQPFISNIVSLSNPTLTTPATSTSSSASNSSSQTIAQLVSNINNSSINNTHNTTPVSSTILQPIIHPIRLITNQSNQLTTNQNNQRNHFTNTTNSCLNQIQLNLSHSNVTLASQNGISTSLNTNTTPSTSSPSSSPLKPNIIRKPRRDSPSGPSTNSVNVTNADQLLNMSQVLNNSAFKQHQIYDLSNSEANGSKIILSTLPFISSGNNQLQTSSQISTLSLTDAQPQVIFAAPSAAPSSSSSSSPSSSSISTLNSSIKPVINLNHNQSDDLKRKFTVNTQNISTNSALATSSSSASSSAPIQQQHQTVPQHDSIDKDKETPQIKDEQYVKRKRRKQEFRKPINDDQAIQYTNNPFCPNRYLNENTNISNNNNNNTNNTTNSNATNQNKLKQNSNSKIINRYLKNDLINIKHGESTNTQTHSYLNPVYLEENLSDFIKDEISSHDDDDLQPPNSKQTKINQTDVNKNHNLEVNSSDVHVNYDEDNDCLDDETVKLLSKEFSYVAANGVKWVTKRRSYVPITDTCKPSWNSLKNHYVHYSDIKPETNDDELDDYFYDYDDDDYDRPHKKKINTANRITSKELIDNLNEWKLHFVISQVKNLMNYENESLDIINDVENLMKDSNFLNYSDVCIKINESIKANSQRHKFVNEQLDEAQLLIHKLFDQKERFKNLMLLSASQSTTSSLSTSGVVDSSTKSFESLLSSSLKSQSTLVNHTNKSTRNGFKKGFKTKNINTRSSNSLRITSSSSSNVQQLNHVNTTTTNNKTSFKQSK